MRWQRSVPLLFTSTILLIGALFACEISRAQDLALVGAKIYPSPAGPAIESATVLVHDGRIAAVGPGTTIQIPKDATVLNCRGMVVTAGFWNSHVHILLPGLLHAKGMDGDLVVLRADPSLDAAAFSKVKYTIRGGKVIHSER